MYKVKEILTIVITTYNREKQLVSQIRSIVSQRLFSDIDLIISDNCSAFDIKSVLAKNFSPCVFERFKIFINPFNIGALGNVARSFLLPSTKWMWLLSDDDETTPKSLNQIFEDIKSYPNVACIKYTDIGVPSSIQHRFHKIDCLGSLVKTCSAFNIDIGNLIFMSNNVFNRHVLNQYIAGVFNYSYTYFPHMVPTLMALSDGKSIVIKPESIVNYKIPEIPVSNNYLVSIYLGAMSVSDIFFHGQSVDYAELRALFKMNRFWDLSKNFYYCSHPDKLYLYKKIYRSVYKDKVNLLEMIIFVLFCIQIKSQCDYGSKLIDFLGGELRQRKRQFLKCLRSSKVAVAD